MISLFGSRRPQVVRRGRGDEIGRRFGVRLNRSAVDMQKVCALSTCCADDEGLTRRLIALLYTDLRGGELGADRLAGLNDAACEALLLHYAGDLAARYECCDGLELPCRSGTTADLARRLVAHILVWERAKIQTYRHFASSGWPA
ncbi:hypothetical protein [Rhodopseudomonas sp. B29]|uniref:hypothetical protein n=1 Tax=Rhodopseudomonas sp. B29 TaxID=95607 RepID=UPI000344F26A|nr:hypothetical protein [Rhodopseudomonas sp. B29]